MKQSGQLGGPVLARRSINPVAVRHRTGCGVDGVVVVALRSGVSLAVWEVRSIGPRNEVCGSARRTPPRRRGQLLRCRHGGNRRNASGQRPGPREASHPARVDDRVKGSELPVTHRFPPWTSWAAFVYGSDSSAAVFAWFSERWSTLLQARAGVRPVFPGQDLQRRRIPRTGWLSVMASRVPAWRKSSPIYEGCIPFCCPSVVRSWRPQYRLRLDGAPSTGGRSCACR